MEKEKLFYNCIRCKDNHEWGEYNINVEGNLKDKVLTMVCSDCFHLIKENAVTEEEITKLYLAAKGQINQRNHNA